MNTVTCSCAKCHSWIGKFDNLWDKIGKTYYSPVCANPNGLGGLVTAGEAREAMKTGVIEDSFLQDLVCKGCSQKLGLRCESVPDGHILERDQLILRIGGMAIIADDTGRRASLRVRNKYSLTGQQAPPTKTCNDRERSASIELNHSAAETNPTIAENDLDLPVDAAPLPVINEDLSPSLIHFAEWAEHAIAEQREDIGRISDVVSKIERDMKSFKDFMMDTRQELAAVPSGNAWEHVKRSVDVIEDEVGNMRAELDERAVAPQRNNDEGVSMSVEELDVLTNSITKISHKVNEIDSLKMELQFMKSKLKRFEDASRNLRQSAEPRSAVNSTALSAIGTPRQTHIRKEISRDTTNDTRTATPRSNGLPRKRKSDEYELGATPLRKTLSITDNNRSRSVEPPSMAHRKGSLHRPSRLSNVQLLDEIPDPLTAEPLSNGIASSNYTEAFTNTLRDYDSAPEGRLPRLPNQPPVRNTIRTSSSPEKMPPPPIRNINRLAIATTNSALGHRARNRAPLANMLPTEPSRRRPRAFSEVVFNADGIRITKSGTPDRRTAKGKYLEEYLEKLRAKKEVENRGPGDGDGEGAADGGEGDGGWDENGPPEGVGAGGNGNEKGTVGGAEAVMVLPSIEKENGKESGNGVRSRSGSQGVTDTEAARRAELEARERLVRETLDREI